MTDVALVLKVDSSEVGKASVALDGLAKDGAKAETSTKKLTTATGSLMNAVKSAAAAFGLYKLGRLVSEMATLNARFETMGIVMKGVGFNAGYSANEMTSFEMTLRKTGISMIEARENVTKMAQAQLDLTKSSELARVAQDAAVIGGINSSEAFARMVHGIQAGQTETLRTIGINVSFEQSYDKLAKTLGVTSKELSETQKAQARMNGVIEYGTRIAGTYEAAMGTAGKQMSSMKRYVEDLKVKLGETFNDALTIAVFGFSDALKDANKSADDLSQDGSLARWGRETIQVLAIMGDFFKNLAVDIKLVGTISTLYVGQVAALAKGRVAEAKQLGSLYAGAFKERNAAMDSMQRATGKFYAVKDAQQQTDLNRERNYLVAVAAVRQKTARDSLAVQQSAMKVLRDKYFPETVKGKPPAPLGVGGESKSTSTKVDPQIAFIAALKKEAETLGMGEEAIQRYENSKMKLSPTNRKLAGELTSTIAAFKSQQEAAKLANEEFDIMDAKLNEQNKVTEEAAKALKKLVEQQEFEVSIIGLSNSAREEAIRTRDAEIAGIDTQSTAYRELNARLNAAYQAQYALTDLQSRFGKSTGIVSSTEQSLQSQVIAGLISETEARTTLRDVIGKQGAALQNELLPQLRAIMATTTDQTKLAEMQQMIDKIKEMVAVGNQKGALAGFQQGIKDFANSAVDSFQTVRDATAKAFKGMEDALVEFVMTGKFNFKDFAGSVIKDLIRIQVQQSLAPITKAISGAVGSFITGLFSANGNAFNNGNQVQPFASGGILGPMGGMLNQPTVFPMANGGLGIGGEAGVEAVMPLKRGSDGKLGVAASGGGGSDSVAVSITINDNRTQTETKSKGEDAGLAAKLGDMIKSTVHAKLIQEMRPGGLLA